MNDEGDRVSVPLSWLARLPTSDSLEGLGRDGVCISGGGARGPSTDVPGEAPVSGPDKPALVSFMYTNIRRQKFAQEPVRVINGFARLRRDAWHLARRRL